jgi:hypothetical protein
LTAPRINRSSTKRTGQLNAASLNERSVKAILAMIWLWQDTADTERIAAQSEATFWFVLPSLPMFLVIPAMLPARAGILAHPRPFLPSDHGPLFPHDLGALPAWRSPLGRWQTSLPC